MFLVDVDCLLSGGAPTLYIADSLGLSKKHYVNYFNGALQNKMYKSLATHANFGANLDPPIEWNEVKSRLVIKMIRVRLFNLFFKYV